jgi:esterase/lipase superfamily enzyme
MAKPIRWTLIGASYVLVAAIVAYAAAHLTRQWVPEHSTPLRTDFPRRLHTEASAVKQTHQFYYATTRPATADLLNDAAAQRSGGLSVGSFEARISPEMAIRPSVWEDPQFLEVMRPQPMEPGRFYGQLKSAMEESPHRSVLIVIWGWKERWLTAAAKTAYISYLLDIDTPVVVFDWPANQGVNLRGYLSSHKIARTSGADLGKFVESVIEQLRPDNLWLVAMSMGSQVVCDAFDYMSVQASLNDDDKEIAHVVLAAPDVAQDEFDRQFSGQIGRLTKHVTVYVSSTDQALLLSNWVNRRSRVGRTPKAQPDDVEQPQFVQAYRLLRLQAKGSKEINVVDVTPINRHRNRHNFLTDDSEFLDELYLRLLRPEDPTSRRLYPVRTEAGVILWILWDQ